MATRPWILPPTLGALAFGCVQIIGVDPGHLRGSGGSGGSGSSGSTSSSSEGGGTTSCEGAMPCSTEATCSAGGCASSCVNDCCAMTPTRSGTACSDNSGSLCDGTGNCVGCLTDGDCESDICFGGFCN